MSDYTQKGSDNTGYTFAIAVGAFAVALVPPAVMLGLLPVAAGCLHRSLSMIDVPLRVLCGIQLAALVLSLYSITQMGCRPLRPVLRALAISAIAGLLWVPPVALIDSLDVPLSWGILLFAQVAAVLAGLAGGLHAVANDDVKERGYYSAVIGIYIGLILVPIFGAYAVWQYSEEPQVRIIRVTDGRTQHSIHADAESLAFSRDGKLIAAVTRRHGMLTWGMRREVRIWRVSDAGRVLTLERKGLEGTGAVAFSPDSSLIAVAYAGNHGCNVDIVRATDGRTMSTLSVPWTLNSAPPVFSPDGDYLALGGGKLGVWKVATQELVWKTRGGGYSPVFSRDGRLIAAADSGSLKIRRSVDGVVVRSVRHAKELDEGDLFPAYLPLLLPGNGLPGSLEGEISVTAGKFDGQKWNYLRDTSRAAFSENGKVIMTSYNMARAGYRARLYSTDTGKRLWEFNGGDPLALSTDGRLAAYTWHMSEPMP